MDIEEYTKKAYNKFGREYEKTRINRQPERAFNEFLELPCMVKTVSNIKNKRLLDIGCGSGTHIKEYVKKGAEVEGIDISETMVELARQKLPKVNFKIGSISKLPYKEDEFDIVTASLTMNYVPDLNKAFSEVNRIMKKGGLFYYSDISPINLAKEFKEDNEHIYYGIGYIKNKKTGKKITLGSHWVKGVEDFEMVPGMIIKNFKRPFADHLHAIVENGFELVDFVDCKPKKEFRKYNPEDYDLYSKFPAFSIYVCKKK
ncbi:class I SAM-dependent methyltransferase [Candidatus Woesearchaeota archaeon]|nr:class I SAM-dependent methyltransferase [Candidatus Woesearchaeota archaeon]